MLPQYLIDVMMTSCNQILVINMSYPGPKQNFSNYEETIVEEERENNQNELQIKKRYSEGSQKYQTRITNDRIKNIALVEWKKTIELIDENAVISFNNGQQKAEEQRYDEAIIDFTEAINIHPKYTEAYLERGAIFGQKEDWQKAIEDYSCALYKKSDNKRAYINRAKAYQKTYNFGLAIRDLNKVIELDPQNFDAYFRIGQAYESLHKHDEAIDSYTSAIKIDPQRKQFYSSRGKVYKETNHYQAASDDFSKALELQPNNPLYLYNLASCHLQLGKSQEASQTFLNSVNTFIQCPKTVMMKRCDISSERYDEVKQLITDYEDVRKQIEYWRKQAEKADLEQILSKIDELTQKNQIVALLKAANGVKDQHDKTQMTRQTQKITFTLTNQLNNLKKIIESAKIKRKEDDIAVKVQLESHAQAINNLDEIITQLRKEVKEAKKKTYMVEDTLDKINKLSNKKQVQYFRLLYQMLINHFIAYRVGSTGFFTQEARTFNPADKVVSQIAKHNFSLSKLPFVGQFLAIPAHLMQRYQGIRTDRINDNMARKIKESNFINEDQITEFMSYAIRTLMEDKKFRMLCQQSLKQDIDYQQKSELTDKFQETKQALDTIIFRCERNELSHVEQVVMMHVTAITEKLFEMGVQEFVITSRDRQQFCKIIYESIMTKGNYEEVEETSRAVTFKVGEVQTERRISEKTVKIQKKRIDTEFKLACNKQIVPIKPDGGCMNCFKFKNGQN